MEYLHDYKCDCCNNPWNAKDLPYVKRNKDATDGEKDIVDAGYMLCSPCLSDDKGYKGIDPANFDFSVSLRDDFYLW